MSRLELAKAAGIDDSYLKRIEDGVAQPSVETCVRIGLALGADVVHRLYPTTGPTIRDRHQAAIAEALLGVTHSRWQPFAEIAVRRPSRGWIDLGLHAAAEGVFVAIEIQSDLRRLEQLVRWSEAKADSLPSWGGFVHLGASTLVSRLLVVRDTRANRAVAAEFRRMLSVAFPANPHDAIDGLMTAARWPGASVLWAARDRTGGGRYRIVARR